MTDAASTPPELPSALLAAAQVSKAWPFEEARKLLKRYPQGKTGPDGRLAPVLFETGYGPSGLPHIGTFQEVLRTTLVRRAYEVLTGGAPTRLVAFSDDMDGLRKVPDNVPNADLLRAHLGHPLSRIPDPFGEYESFAHHNNAMLREFLDRFGFDYEFVSASDRYNSGGFDDALRTVLRQYQAIMDIMLPTLREERRQTYSPVLPVSAKSGQVLQVPVTVVDAEAGIIRFEDEGETVEQSILGGRAKLQWKVDWAMRWVALGVDYEMCGKDLTDSVTQSGKIARVLGGQRPEGLIYELFLDDKGEKISKSKGNGLTIEQWLTYGSEESLGFYLYRDPKSAKSLHVGIIPRAVDEYWQFREKLPEQPVEQQLGNPVWHLLRTNGQRGGAGDKLPVTYGLLLNLVGVLGADNALYSADFRATERLGSGHARIAQIGQGWRGVAAIGLVHSARRRVGRASRRPPKRKLRPHIEIAPQALRRERADGERERHAGSMADASAKASVILGTCAASRTFFVETYCVRLGV